MKKVKLGDIIKLTESKTKKKAKIAINGRMLKSLRRHLRTSKFSADDYLFKSPKTRKALTSMRMGDIVKEVAAAIGLRGQYSAHTMRKTFGYFHYKVLNSDPLLIQKAYNHNDLSTTFRYIGVTDEAVNSMRMTVI